MCFEAIDWVGTQPVVEHDRGLCVTSNRLDFGWPELKENVYHHNPKMLPLIDGAEYKLFDAKMLSLTDGARNKLFGAKMLDPISLCGGGAFY